MKKPANLDWLRAYMSYQMSLELSLVAMQGIEPRTLRI